MARGLFSVREVPEEVEAMVAVKRGRGTADTYKRSPVNERYDAIVIGSGIGGLATAALLAKDARRVLLLERHYAVGGFTQVFHRPGYEWDVGVHYVGSVQPGTPIRALFDEVTGGRLEWEDMGPIYERVVMGRDVYDFPKGQENLRAAFKAWFPAEAAGIDRYFDLLQDAASAFAPYYLAKALGTAQDGTGEGFLRHADRTTREVLESLTANQRLIGVLTAQWGCYGLPPAQSSFLMHALVASSYSEGACYPVGGAGRIAETILPVIQAAGGKVLVSAEVTQILIEGGRAVGVQMADGAQIRAPIVVSDAGFMTTFGRLVPPDVTARSGLDKQLAAVRPSAAHICLYIGARHTAAELGLGKPNLWIYPDEHHDRNMAAALAGAHSAPPFAYISFPSAKDPDFGRRHPGRATIQAMTFAPYDAFARWENCRWKRRGDDYEALKDKLARQLLDVVYRHVPQLRGKIDYYELSTPLSTRHCSNYSHGEMYGVEATPARFRLEFLRPQTPIPGLYLTGQDVATLGIPAALFGGALCAWALEQASVPAAASA